MYEAVIGDMAARVDKIERKRERRKVKLCLELNVRLYEAILLALPAENSRQTKELIPYQRYGISVLDVLLLALLQHRGSALWW